MYYIYWWLTSDRSTDLWIRKFQMAISPQQIMRFIPCLVLGTPADNQLFFCFFCASAPLVKNFQLCHWVTMTWTWRCLHAWSTGFVCVQAANYLDIKGLLDVTCKTVANMIKGKTPEEIRKTFNIKNDFTPAEEEQVGEYWFLLGPFTLGSIWSSGVVVWMIRRMTGL